MFLRLFFDDSARVFPDARGMLQHFEFMHNFALESIPIQEVMPLVAARYPIAIHPASQTHMAASTR